MKVIYKRLKTKSGGEQDVIIVPGSFVTTHNHYLETYLYSPKEDWLSKYDKACGIIEREIDVDEDAISRLREIGEIYIDPRGRLHPVENDEFHHIFNAILEKS